MASSWFFIVFLVLTVASVRCTTVDHMPSTDEDARDYSKLKTKTEEATDEHHSRTQQAKDELKSKADHAANEVKSNTQQAKDRASEVGKEAKEYTESWTEWAKEKISEGLGFKQDDDPKGSVEKAFDSVADTATKTKDKLQDMASG
nr:D-29 protein [Gossypium hirsutum]